MSQTNQTNATLRSEEKSIAVPALVAQGFPLQPLTSGKTAGGWSVFRAKDEAEARAFMATYPQAAMPCWKRPDFFSCQVRA